MIAEVYYKNLNRDIQFQTKPKERKVFLSEAKKWYKIYVEAHTELKKDNDVTMIYNGLDSEIKMIDNPDNLKMPEDNKKVALTDEQKKKKEEILKERKLADKKAKKEECLKEGKSEEECNLMIKKDELQERYDSCVESKTEEECAPLLEEYKKALEGNTSTTLNTPKKEGAKDLVSSPLKKEEKKVTPKLEKKIENKK
jgi:hypothetical protein